MKQTLVFLFFALLVVGFLFAISGERSPRIPEDDMHVVVDSNEVCRECHGPGKMVEMKDTHPPKDQCILCHKVKRNRKTR